MRTFQSKGFTYWEGSVDVNGIGEASAIEDKGYVELTGNAEPFDARLKRFFKRLNVSPVSY
jgi:hypothetical protein